MYCENCGKQLIRGYQFCIECGTPIPPNAFDEEDESAPESPAESGQKAEESADENGSLVFCPNCGMHIQSSTNFCEICGIRLHGAKQEIPLINPNPVDPFAEYSGGLDGGDNSGGLDEGITYGNEFADYVGGGGITPSEDTMFGGGIGEGIGEGIGDPGIADNELEELQKQLDSFSAAGEIAPVFTQGPVRQREPELGEAREVEDFAMDDTAGADIIGGDVPVIAGGSMDEDPANDVDLDPYSFVNNVLEGTENASPVEPAPVEEYAQPVPVEPAPVEEIAQTVPVEDALVEEIAQPVPVEDASVEEIAQPVPVEDASVEEIAQPVPVEDAPIEEIAQPVPVEDTPVEEIAQPVPVEDTPVEEIAQPVPVEPTPVEEIAQPVPVEDAPIEEIAQPVPVEPTPVEEYAQPVPVETAPVEEIAQPVPVEDASVEEIAQPVPIEDASVEEIAQPVPVEDTPVEEIAQPMLVEDAPVEEIAQPVPVETAPVEENAQPVGDTPISGGETEYYDDDYDNYADNDFPEVEGAPVISENPPVPPTPPEDTARPVEVIPPIMPPVQPTPPIQPTPPVNSEKLTPPEPPKPANDPALGKLIYCHNCGQEMYENEPFCRYCNAPNSKTIKVSEKKKSHKALFGIIGGAAAIAIIAGAVIVINTNKPDVNDVIGDDTLSGSNVSLMPGVGDPGNESGADSEATDAPTQSELSEKTGEAITPEKTGEASAPEKTDEASTPEKTDKPSKPDPSTKKPDPSTKKPDSSTKKPDTTTKKPDTTTKTPATTTKTPVTTTKTPVTTTKAPESTPKPAVQSDKVKSLEKERKEITDAAGLIACEIGKIDMFAQNVMYAMSNSSAKAETARKSYYNRDFAKNMLSIFDSGKSSVDKAVKAAKPKSGELSDAYDALVSLQSKYEDYYSFIKSPSGNETKFTNSCSSYISDFNSALDGLKYKKLAADDYSSADISAMYSSILDAAVSDADTALSAFSSLRDKLTALDKSSFESESVLKLSENSVTKLYAKAAGYSYAVSAYCHILSGGSSDAYEELCSARDELLSLTDLHVTVAENSLSSYSSASRSGISSANTAIAGAKK